MRPPKHLLNYEANSNVMLNKHCSLKIEKLRNTLFQKRHFNRRPTHLSKHLRKVLNVKP